MGIHSAGLGIYPRGLSNRIYLGWGKCSNAERDHFTLLLFSVFHPFLDMLLVEWLQHGCFATSPRAWPPHNYLDITTAEPLAHVSFLDASSIKHAAPQPDVRTAHSACAVPLIDGLGQEYAFYSEESDTG